MSIAAALKDLLRRVRALEVAQPTGYTSITRGSLRVASNEGLLVQGSAKVEGWLVVTGTQRTTGRLEGSGTFDWTGPLFLKGATIISGTLEVSGATMLKSDLTVVAPGKIKAGNIEIEPSTDGGAVKIGSATLSVRNAFATLFAGSGVSIGSGLMELRVTSAGVRLINYGTITRANANQAVIGTAWIEPDGTIKRVV